MQSFRLSHIIWAWWTNMHLELLWNNWKVIQSLSIIWTKVGVPTFGSEFWVLNNRSVYHNLSCVSINRYSTLWLAWTLSRPIWIRHGLGESRITIPQRTIWLSFNRVEAFVVSVHLLRSYVVTKLFWTWCNWYKSFIWLIAFMYLVLTISTLPSIFYIKPCVSFLIASTRAANFMISKMVISNIAMNPNSNINTTSVHFRVTLLLIHHILVHHKANKWTKNNLF